MSPFLEPAKEKKMKLFIFLHSPYWRMAGICQESHYLTWGSLVISLMASKLFLHPSLDNPFITSSTCLYMCVILWLALSAAWQEPGYNHHRFHDRTNKRKGLFEFQMKRHFPRDSVCHVIFSWPLNSREMTVKGELETSVTIHVL